MNKRRYTPEEAQAILAMAARKGPNGDEVEHDDLVAAAAEAGIDPALVEEAARELDRRGVGNSVVAQGGTHPAEVIARGKLVRHATAYFSVSAAFMIFAIAIREWPPALAVPILWGVFFFIHMRSVIFPTQHELDRRRKKWERVEEKERIRAARARAIEERARSGKPWNRLEEVGARIGSIVEDNVASILEETADQLLRRRKPSQRRVDAKASARTSRSEADDRVRVSQDAEDDDEFDDQSKKQRGR